MDILKLIGRTKPLFHDDIKANNDYLKSIISTSNFLVIGGAGSIGQAVTKEIFKRNPKTLHVVDISENNMVELVRDIRSTLGYIPGEFKTFAIDCGSMEFKALLNSGVDYNYVLNLSALKHVRSEKDPYTLSRLIEVNIENTISTINLAKGGNLKKYFCVSTDKAANPVNMMGASKRIMEMFLMKESINVSLSMARFANVAFSDGSLLHGFNQRFVKKQPISAPNDVRRYFVTPQESGELCLASCLLGNNRDIFFPKLSEELDLITFSDIAINYLANLGYKAIECSSEEEARQRVDELIPKKMWPCYFFSSDTTGEKDFEEFFTDSEILDMESYKNIGVIQHDAFFDETLLNKFESGLSEIRESGQLEKKKFLKLFKEILPLFGHKETGKYLDDRM
ncbi:UDP-N-acetylglucosamine 4,6-dehydratase [Gammaproteobacteria bacterium]|nr:UDP-N-acetylglucosamine 4,6-dehydratase [Gammaproteobacteria bacterium]